MKSIISRLLPLIFIFAFAGCSPKPESISLGKDTCDFCHMIIANKQFGGEIITKDGQIFKFDDSFCIASYRALRMDSTEIKSIFLINYAPPHNFIDLSNATLVHSSELPSPMGGNTAAFNNKTAADEALNSSGGKEITREELFLIRAEN